MMRETTKSFLTSINELNTIKRYGINIKIFCFSGITYSALRGTQKDFFGSRFVGTDSDYENKYYNLKKIISNFNIKFYAIKKPSKINHTLKKIISLNKSTFCSILVNPNQQISPKMGFSLTDSGNWYAKPLEDMYPFLPKKTIQDSMK